MACDELNTVFVESGNRSTCHTNEVVKKYQKNSVS